MFIRYLIVLCVSACLLCVFLFCSYHDWLNEVNSNAAAAAATATTTTFGI